MGQTSMDKLVDARGTADNPITIDSSPEGLMSTESPVENSEVQTRPIPLVSERAADNSQPD